MTSLLNTEQDVNGTNLVSKVDASSSANTLPISDYYLLLKTPNLKPVSIHLSDYNDNSILVLGKCKT